MNRPPRWITDTKPGHSQWYIDRFRTLAAEGADLAGEARFVDALLAPGSRILDAGCGTGRVGGELQRRGHQVVGVDVDEALIAAAQLDHPGPTWLRSDLSELDLAAHGITEPFDAAVLAGNVMTFLAEGSEPQVLRQVSQHVRPEGYIVVGFGLSRGYSLQQFDSDITAAGLIVEQRFATWDLRPFRPDADFAVTILQAAS